MKALFFLNSISYANTQFPPPMLLFHFPSLSRENKNFLHISPSKSVYRYPKPSSTILYPIKASSSSSQLSYGGWDNLQLGDDLANSGESSQLPEFLVSIGVDDKKHIFMFLLGIFCAFSISRVRVSSIIVFPATVLVFIVGFSFGFVRGGRFNEFSVSAIKRRAKEETSKVFGEKLRSLLGLFDGFNVKVDGLRKDVQRAIDTREIELKDLENYVNAIDSIKTFALNSRNVVETAIDSVGDSSGVLVENQKSSNRKSNEIGKVGVELLQFVGGLFGEKAVNSKPNKVKQKENVKQATAGGLTNDQIQGNNSNPVIEKKLPGAFGNDKGSTNSVYSQDLTDKSALDWDGDRRIRIASENEELDLGETGGSVKRFLDTGDYSYNNNRIQFTRNEMETWSSQDNIFDSVDFRVNLKHTETEASIVQERMFKKSSGTNRSSYSRKMSEDEAYKFPLKQERVNDDVHSANYRSVPDQEVGSSSSLIEDDVVFDRYLSEANSLLKQAKECIGGRLDEEHAEIILCKSAKLLSRAIVMKPMSLLAVGQLGNTYLLHGELKLKISRELRTLLKRRDPLSFEQQGRILKGIDDLNKDELASALVNVCEECEDLLVKAGRKYRLALSIDGNDVRALYNWGLALSFRAQLIADIGPEAAFDADKVFLAAIDKFDAMMARGNIYAPDALFRWGMVLQQRSRLRPTNSKEKVKLLQQAKRLYEDALDMDSDNLQVREALTSCMSELNHRLL